jgi:hypothetical protein
MKNKRYVPWVVPNNAIVPPNLEKTPKAPTFSLDSVFWTAASNKPAEPVNVAERTD